LFRTPTIYGVDSDHGSTGDRVVEISRVAQNRMRRPEYVRKEYSSAGSSCFLRYRRRLYVPRYTWAPPVMHPTAFYVRLVFLETWPVTAVDQSIPCLHQVLYFAGLPVGVRQRAFL